MKQKKYLVVLIVVLVVVAAAYFLAKDRIVVMFKGAEQQMWHEKQLFDSPEHRRKELCRFVNFYNTVKPHRSLNGEIDGVAIVLVPTSYLPDKVEFFVTHAVATTAPVKLQDYKIHDNPPGINGSLVEGRVRYDAFVLDNKKKAIYVHKKA